MWDYNYFYLWAALLLSSSLFSGMEMAFVASDRMHFMMSKKEKGLFNFILNRIYRHPRQFLAALSIGNIISLILFSYLSLDLFYGYAFHVLNLSSILAVVIIGILASVIIVVTGEVLPRAIMAHNPNMWTKLLCLPTYLLYLILLPFSLFFNYLGGVLLSLIGISKSEIDEELINRDEIDSFLRKGLEEISEDHEAESEIKILRNAIDFSSMKVRDCMVPRADIVGISLDSSKDFLTDMFVDSGLSRVLVYKEDLDDIVGYIHVWEMFEASDKWSDKVAEISFVPESMLASKLMSELMQQHRSIAVVVDEFGGTSGIVTMEDLVEEIFGEIEDEFDDQSKFVKKYSDNEYVLSGRAEIDTLNDEYEFGLPTDDDYSTIAGLLLHHMQRIPDKNEVIIIGPFTFKILKVTSRKIEVVRLNLDMGIVAHD